MGRDIVKKESPLALYKGLGAVVAGIVPKMAIRFSSFEAYKGYLADKTTGKVATSSVFLAGLGAGVTEAVAVVSPMECIKIRLQAQHHSMADPLDVPRYRNAAHAAYTIVREEGFATLYRGVTLTATRQATNQGADCATCYKEIADLASCQFHCIPRVPEVGQRISRHFCLTVLSELLAWRDIRCHGTHVQRPD